MQFRILDVNTNEEYTIKQVSATKDAETLVFHIDTAEETSSARLSAKTSLNDPKDTKAKVEKSDSSEAKPVSLDRNTKELFKFFSPSVPCWFDGCEELREQYKNEKQKLLDKHDGNCPACAEGQLVNKYLAIIKQKVK